MVIPAKNATPLPECRSSRTQPHAASNDKHGLTASAISTYAYSGLDFTFVIGSMSVSGSFDAASNLNPNLTLEDIGADLLSFSFTDGRTVFTEADSTIGNFVVDTDGTGAITGWTIALDQDVPATTVGDVQMSLGTQFTSDFGNVSECLTADGS